MSSKAGRRNDTRPKDKMKTVPWQLKKVKSSTGPMGTNISAAIQKPESVPGQTELLWIATTSSNNDDRKTTTFKGRGRILQCFMQDKCKWASMKMTLKFCFLWSTLFWLEESVSALYSGWLRDKSEPDKTLGRNLKHIWFGLRGTECWITPLHLVFLILWHFTWL